MTLKDLKYLYDYKQLLKHEQEKLVLLTERAVNISQHISDMPRSPSPQNGHEAILIGIKACKDKITEYDFQITRIEAELAENLAKFGSPHIRLIVAYRFDKKMSWQEVAEELGGNNTENSVKLTFRRFLQKSQKSEKRKIYF